MRDGAKIRLGLTYDDVLLVPKYCDIGSRKEIDVGSKLSKNISLNIPIVSANMDTVTEARMAIAMASRGGIGIIHRFLTIEEEVAEVRRVKRSQNFIIDDPVTIAKEATLKEALELMKKNGVSGLLVCGSTTLTTDAKKIEGILTSRDVRFKTDMTTSVEKIMTPRDRLITAKRGISGEKAVALLDKYKIEKLPLIDSRDRITGLITASDFKKFRENKMAAKDKDGQLLCGAAIGVRDGILRGQALVEAGADVLVIDIAHGHHKSCIELTKKLKKRFPGVDVVAGNVATREGAEDLIAAGADAVKVGIGPGAACSTRIVAGAGVPQFSAILSIAPVARKRGVPIIADGGIRTSGDVAKAMAAGASSVMAGNLFAGSYESPGEYYIEDGSAFKVYRGLASRDASIDRQLVEQNKDRQDRAPEGVSFRVTYKGEVGKIVQNLIDGLQSGMSYTGAKNIKEFWRRAEFVRITEAGVKESFPRTNQI